MLDCQLMDIEEIRALIRQDSTLVLFSPTGEPIYLQWKKDFGPALMAHFLAHLDRNISFVRLVMLTLSQIDQFTEAEIVCPRYQERTLLYHLCWKNKTLHLLNDGDMVYAGPFWDFPLCVQNKQLGLNLVGKVVKFFYSGGSQEGYRTVQLTTVGPDQEGNLILKGKDLAKDAFRTYCLDKIKDKILVVN